MDIVCDYNKAFKHLFYPSDKHRFHLEMGGAGSGKSFAISQSIVMDCLADTRGQRKWLVVRKVRSTIRHSVWDLFKNVMREMGCYGLFGEHVSDFSFRCITGSQIICTGLDDPEKLKSIFGITDVWIEEATELSLADFRQINLRLRGGNLHKKVIMSFNPISTLSWIKKEFYDTPKLNASYNHTTFENNRFIDDEYRRELISLEDVDQYFHTVYRLGQWGVLGNLVFTNYVIEDFDYTEGDLENVCQGQDYGFNHASVMIRLGFRDGEMYVFDELYAKQKTNNEFIALGKDFDPDYRDHIYICETAEPARIKEFNSEGWCCYAAKKGAGSLKAGIDFLLRFKIHIHSKRCPNTAKEVQSLKRRETKDGEVLDEIVEINDDCIAAMRYATEPLWSELARWRPL